MSKNRRRIEVFKYIKSAKRATPEEVTFAVGKILEKSPNDKAFKRSIYRDLKMYLETHQIGADYFSQSGETLDVEDELTSGSYRVEYYDLGHRQTVSGVNLLEELGGSFSCSKVFIDELKVSKGIANTDDNFCQFLIDFGHGQFLTFSFLQDLRPLKIIVLRQPDDKDETPDFKQLRELFGVKTNFLLLPHRGVSRFKNNNQPGHLLFELTSEKGKVQILDFNSSLGTFWSSELEEFSSHVETIKNQKTTTHNPYKNISWEKVSDSQNFNTPILIKIGETILGFIS